MAKAAALKPHPDPVEFVLERKTKLVDADCAVLYCLSSKIMNPCGLSNTVEVSSGLPVSKSIGDSADGGSCSVCDPFDTFMRIRTRRVPKTRS